MSSLFAVDASAAPRLSLDTDVDICMYPSSVTMWPNDAAAAGSKKTSRSS